MQSGGTIEFNDSNMPDELIKKLGYNPIFENPLGIVLNKHSEFYLTAPNKILPYAIIAPGDMFGITRLLNNLFNNVTNDVPFFMWELTSGAKSIFLLSKIGDKMLHNKLQKEFAIITEAPKTYHDHHRIFKELCTKNNVDWHSEFLFFSNQWLKDLSKFPELQVYFLQRNFKDYKFWRDFISWQISFDHIEKNKNIAVPMYINSIVRNLFMIAAGALLGFRPVTDEAVKPTKLVI